MRLKQIISDIHPIFVSANIDGIDIAGLQFDSREVTAGDLFIAVPGFTCDGSKFIRDAVNRGAKAIICRTPVDDLNVPQIVVRDVRSAMASAAKSFFGDPSRDMAIIGVTGTNGKTTTAYLIRYLLNAMNIPCGMLGTIENDLGNGETIEAQRTTPEAVDIYRYLDRMRKNGLMAAVLEVSSHALALNRVKGLNFKSAVFTNLTQDHLGFHGTMENYRDAKGLLFEQLAGDATAVLNAGQLASVQYAMNTPAKVVKYSTRRSGDLLASQIQCSIKNTDFTMRFGNESASVHWQMIGRYNIENALAATSAVLSLGLPLQWIAKALSSFPGVPGRMEQVAPDNCPYAVYVDYAHTDDALSNVLDAVRKLQPKRIVTVFGCGGDRDRTKRPKMAKAAEKGSDVVVITSDNPRSEDAEAIIQDILVGIEDKQTVIVQPDRRAAIRTAIQMASGSDAVLIAGKGHETYQIFSDRTDHFDDREEARIAIQQFASELKNITKAA